MITFLGAQFELRIQIIFFILLVSFVTTPAVHASFPINKELPGPKSKYTEWIVNWVSEGNELRKDLMTRAKDSEPNKMPVYLRCVETPKNDLYIGLEQFMTIKAPISAVENVMDHFEYYQELFPGFKDIHLVSQDSNFFTLYFEQIVPVFFIPNVKYELYYVVTHPTPTQKIYRYKLKEEGQLKQSDGVIFLEQETPELTRYMEYDFFDADWGIAKLIAPGRIWRDSVEGIYESDVAIQLKAENPNLDYKTVRQMSHDTVEKFPVDECLKHKVPLNTEPSNTTTINPHLKVEVNEGRDGV